MYFKHLSMNMGLYSFVFLAFSSFKLNLACICHSRHLPQQQKKKLTWIVSEDDEDEDDESLDHGYNPKKEIGHQKCRTLDFSLVICWNFDVKALFLDSYLCLKFAVDNAQQLEGKNMDNKGLTPRSKHSATEQRRRSKINDRFSLIVPFFHF